MRILRLLAAVGIVMAAIAWGPIARCQSPSQFSVNFQPGSAATAETPQAASTPHWKNLDSWLGYLGFGFTPPVGTSHNRVNTGWNFIAGFGPRLGHEFALPVDFTYQYASASHSIQFGTRQPISGHMDMWSLTLNPTFETQIHKVVGWYATLGYGLYNRRIDITQATLVGGVFCDPWWGFCSPGVVPATAVIGEHSTYKGGWNLGTGFTFGPPHMKFFAEVRYHFVYTSPVRTETLPITFGIRW